MASQLTIGIVIAAALADSINPCVFGVLIFLMGYMLTAFKSKARLLIGGLIYIATVYVTYFLIGLGILSAAYSANLTNSLYMVAAVIAITSPIPFIFSFFTLSILFLLDISIELDVAFFDLLTLANIFVNLVLTIAIFPPYSFSTFF